MLGIIVVALPLYWVFEPSRQAGAEEGWDNRFASWGSQLFAPTADGGFNCAGCHGGMAGVGGEAPFTVTDPVTQEVQAVNWKAPAVNTVFYKFDESEVRFILNYGRPFSPMSPWGLVGGGPMNTQQIDNLIAYMKSIQIPRENCGEGEDDARICDSGNLPADLQADIQAAAEKAVADGEADSDRRGAVQPRPRERRLQLRSLPHPRVELRPARRVGPGSLRLEPHRRLGQLALRRRRPVGAVPAERFGVRQALWSQRPGKRPDARIRITAHRRADPRNRRIRTELVTMTLLAIGWEPELRGLLTVVIGVVILCGSVYGIMATNMGSRLAFLVALAGSGRLDDADGCGLGDLRHRSARPRPVVAGGPRRRCAAGRQRARCGGRARTPMPTSPTTPRRDRVGRDRARHVHRPGLGRARQGVAGIRPGAGLCVRGPDRGGRLRRRPVRDRRGVRHRRRAVPEDQRHARLLRVLPHAALRRRRGGAVRAGAHRAGSRPCHAPRSTRTASASTSTWCATWAPVASRRSC